MLYRWLKAKVGRKPEQVEWLDGPQVARWLSWGWIAPVAGVKAHVEPPAPVEDASVEAPPFHRAMRSRRSRA